MHGLSMFHTRIKSSRFASLLGALLCLSLAPTNPARAADPAKLQAVKVLAIGNSLTGNAVVYLSAFAHAGGKQITIFAAAPGGRSLENHADALAASQHDPADPKGLIYRKVGKPPADPKAPNMCSLIEALDSNKWDYVTLQQLSGLSYKPESFEPAAGQLIEAIHQHAPQAKILAYQTWPYRVDHPLFKTGGFTRQTMFEGIKTAYDGLASKYRLRVIPAGEAFLLAEQSPLWQFTPDTTYDYKNPPPDALPKESGTLQRGWARLQNGKLILDAKHANPAGCYLVGAVWYEVLFGDDVRPVMPKIQAPGLDPEREADLRRVAHEIVTVRDAARIPEAPEAVKRLEAPHSPATNAPDTTLNGAKPSPGVTPVGGDE